MEVKGESARAMQMNWKGASSPYQTSRGRCANGTSSQWIIKYYFETCKLHNESSEGLSSRDTRAGLHRLFWPTHILTINLVLNPVGLQMLPMCEAGRQEHAEDQRQSFPSEHAVLCRTDDKTKPKMFPAVPWKRWSLSYFPPLQIKSDFYQAETHDAAEARRKGVK